MAKDQDLPLNPLKISGACGKLLCCLKYEHPLYTQFKESAPAIGETVTTDEGDHFSGSAPTPAGCTGTPGKYCSYTTRSELNVNLPGLLATEREMLAKRIADAPAMWISIPMWGRVFNAYRKLFRLDRKR